LRSLGNKVRRSRPWSFFRSRKLRLTRKCAWLTWKASRELTLLARETTWELALLTRETSWKLTGLTRETSWEKLLPFDSVFLFGIIILIGSIVIQMIDSFLQYFIYYFMKYPMKGEIDYIISYRKGIYFLFILI
jgi:hypothetical protein